MFGKLFESVHEGSMVGSGFHVFAIWGYVVSRNRPDKDVTLNPAVLSAVFGEPADRVQAAIDYLCAPDPNTTTPGEDGKRLIKTGQFNYRVVNGAKYRAIRSEEQRREQNRTSQATFRAKVPARAKTPFARHPIPSNGEAGII